MKLKLTLIDQLVVVHLDTSRTILDATESDEAAAA